ncbi:hypothetical protein WJX84_005874 [Apatococcus fuscideae]|uniref:protein-S-isoprenylcysteine alpha-carbonyl methylesterase n=1 Tax=Apatococcus fuscideae TaxID=2026836 RepID=A0AAW1RWD9_9CHLO
MSVWEALKGAQVELAAIPTAAARLSRFKQLTRLLAGELIGILQVIPFGVRAFWTYHRLPRASDKLQANRNCVAVCKGLRYGSAVRALVDVYIPSQACAVGRLLPVALFCHGGVWANGERWHYAPLAKRLAQAGIMTAVIGYTLYPQASTHEMAAEVSQALSWVQDNAAHYGGSPKQVSLVGHSAGAHLVMMALLDRAKFARSRQRTQTQTGRDGRLPFQLVGMCGVYDIARHYAYEEGRGVAGLSTMKRAVGGTRGFAAASPAVIVSQVASQRMGTAQTVPPAAGRSGGAAELQGRALGQAVTEARPGLFTAPAVQKPAQCNVSTQSSRQSADSSSAPAQRQVLDAQDTAPDGLPRVEEPKAIGSEPTSGRSAETMSFSPAEAALLPPIVLMHGVEDLIVPWQQSLEMAGQLGDAGVSCEQLLYKQVSHADFATAWHPLPDQQVAKSQHLPDFAADLIQILGGEAQIKDS